MTTKKIQAKTDEAVQRAGFTYRPDGIRARQIDELIQKKGASKQGIISIAISEMHEREFPARKS
jgi:hypothetical protein